MDALGQDNREEGASARHVWAIGDVQGCGQTLENLLARIDFENTDDEALFVGDLVNRGPSSLAVLRRLRAFGDRVTVVLGNHDLHLLARAAGLPAKDRDTLDDILAAPDREDLLDWVRSRPVVHERAYGPGEWVMVHAGFYPSWSLETARAWARAVEAELRGPHYLEAVRRFRRAEPGDELAAAVGCLTRIRMVDPDGNPTGYSGPLGGAPDGLTPWWTASPIAQPPRTVIIGHWAALGLRRTPGLLATDTGCIWGRTLTAVRLDDGLVVSEPCAERLPRRHRGARD